MKRKPSMSEMLLVERDKIIVGLQEQLETWHQQVRCLEEQIKNGPRRKKMSDLRHGLTVKLRINGKSMVTRCPTCDGPDLASPVVSSLYLTVNFFEDGAVGEVFVRLDRDGRAGPAAYADEWAKSLSYGIQNGADLGWYLEKARHVRDSSGGTPLVWDEARDAYHVHPAIRHVGSVVDYISFVVERIATGKPATALAIGESK